MNSQHAAQATSSVSARAAPAVRSWRALAPSAQAAQIEQCGGRRVAVLGLEDDLNQLAADDRLGRKLQDLALEPKRRAPRRTLTVAGEPT